MLNQRHAAARAVANELLPAEKIVDEAIVRNAKLAIAVVEGRRSAKLPLTAGQEALGYVAQANLRLCEARGLLAEAHRSFRQTQAEIGLNAFSYGDEQRMSSDPGRSENCRAGCKRGLGTTAAGQLSGRRLNTWFTSSRSMSSSSAAWSMLLRYGGEPERQQCCPRRRPPY